MPVSHDKKNTGLVLSIVQPAKPRTVSATRCKVAFTPAARRALTTVARRDGPQAILLAWPAGAAYLPRADYVPHIFDVIVGHVAGCPIYVDTRRLAMFSDQRVVLDADSAPRSDAHPVLVAQPAPMPADDAAARAAIATVPADPGRALQRELAAQFAETFSDAQIWTYVQDAINDLRGSVSAEALPEMAARLARHRLSTIVKPTRPGTS
jgi:uncharacterized protein (DUF779 family)